MESQNNSRHFAWPLFALLSFYVIIVVAQSVLKLIWGDELFTLYIARTGSLQSIWHALKAGADPNPPLTHLSVLLSTRLFGINALALRLPSIVYVGVALVSLWSILLRFVAKSFAAIGVLAFMCTRGFDYSYDARSYAPMLGFAMLSLALWFASADHGGLRRAGLLALMATALAAGIFSNYYCVLAFFPIAAGQTTQDIQRRRIAIPVWLALALAALPLLTLLPLIRHNISEFGPYAWNRPRLSMISLSYFELVEGILWPTLLFAILTFFRRTRTLMLPPPALAALITLLAYPFLGYLIAIGGAGMISPRCVAPVCCGVGLLASLTMSCLFSSDSRSVRIVLTILVLWVVARESFCATLLFEQRRAFMHIREKTERLDHNRPILVADSSLVLPLYFYSSPATASQIVFPIDFRAIHEFEKDDSGEQNLWAGRYGVFPFPVVPFSRPEAPVLVIARSDGWLAHLLVRSGVTLAPTEFDPAWDKVGGVFSPMAHSETRFIDATP